MSELGKYIQKPTFIKVKLLDGTAVNVRKWVMNEEKDFLFAIETRGREDNDIMIEESINLARRCVEKPAVIDKLSKNNLLYLLSEMRKLSKGDQISFQYRCVNEKCPDWIEYPPERVEKEGVKGGGNTLLDGRIDLDTDLTTKAFVDKPIKIRDFKFHIKEVPYIIQKEMDSKYLSKLQLNEWNYEYVLASIKAIEPEKDKKITKFTRDELIGFLGQLTSDEFKTLSDSIGENISEFAIKKKVKCPMCDNETDIVYEELFSLMVF